MYEESPTPPYETLTDPALFWEQALVLDADPVTGHTVTTEGISRTASTLPNPYDYESKVGSPLLAQTVAPPTGL
jgi:hypothetical protein